MSYIKKNGTQRWSPSYLRNRGHMSKAQKRAYRTLWPKYGVDLNYNSVLDFGIIFGVEKPIVLEIGFGQGENILHRCQNEPDKLFVGVEVHKPGIANLLPKITTENLRIIRADALFLLADHMPKKSISEVLIFFPDPWHDERNHHRRILRSQTLTILSSALQKNAKLCFATDVKEYAEQAIELLNKNSDWKNLHKKFSPRPINRPISKYEHKAKLQGHKIYNLEFVFDPKS